MKRNSFYLARGKDSSGVQRGKVDIEEKDKEMDRTCSFPMIEFAFQVGASSIISVLLIPKKLLGKLEKRRSLFPLSATGSVTGCRPRFNGITLLDTWPRSQPCCSVYRGRKLKRW